MFNKTSEGLKGTVHPKMKMTPWFAQAIRVYDFLLSDKYNQSYVKKCPVHSKARKSPSFIVNGCWDCEDHKSAFIHHKPCSTQLQAKQAPVRICWSCENRSQHRKTSLLLAHIAILQHFSSTLWPLFCFALTLWLWSNATLSCKCIRQLVEARDDCLFSYKYGYFTYINALFSFRSHLLTAWSHVEHFLWWMDALFWALKSRPPFTAIIKLGSIFNITLIVFI